MFPKKIIGRYIGNDSNGVTIGKIHFLPNHSIECCVTEEMYNEINNLCSQGIFHLFEFASVNMIADVTDSIESVTEEVIALTDTMLELGDEVDCKYDDVNYDREEGELSFYSKEKVIKTLSLPVPQAPREIELSKNDTHLLWRQKPISYEIIEWEELIALSDIVGTSCNDVELIDRVTELERKIKEIESGI